jgi:hypothetical protein
MESITRRMALANAPFNGYCKMAPNPPACRYMAGATALLVRCFLRVYKSNMLRHCQRVLYGLLGSLLLVTPALAHHSFASEYDVRRPVTMSGSVTTVEWTNPHVRFHMNVKDESGTVHEWEFTMGAVNGLFRRGWTRQMLKPGDVVTVDGYLAWDGSRLANARTVTLRDGRKMSGGTTPDANEQ